MIHESQATPAWSQNNLRVFQALRQASGPLTAYQILDWLKKDGVSAPPTVYRALRRLVTEGVVHRVETLNAYVVCTCPDHPGSPVFAICEQCSSVTEFPDEMIEARLRQRADAIGFGFRAASIEIRGECADCRANRHLEVRQ